MLKKGAIIETKVEKLVFGGLGLSTIDGLKLFVPDAVPGDIVQIRVTKKKQNFAEGRIETIISPSPQRIAARCKHFAICGGCTWQFLSYQDQLFYKQQIVQESLEHIGGFNNIIVNSIFGCEKPWNYRNKMEFSSALDKEAQADLGLHPKGYHYDVFTLTECHLSSPRYAEIVQTLRHWLRENQVLPYEPKTSNGYLKHVMIRHNRQGHLMLNFVTAPGNFPELASLQQTLTATDITAVLHTQVQSVRGKPTTRQQQTLWGRDYLEEEMSLPEPWGKLEFRIYPEAFFQPNPTQAQILYATALNLADIQSDDIFLDLYCGTGTLGLFASKKAKQVYGIDNVGDAIKSAEANALKNNVANAKFFVGDAAALIKQQDLQPTVAIIDPPRAGMNAEAIEIFAKLKLRKLVYISCNPTTQARDLKLLCERGYQLKHVQPVDMFPHTYHIENIAVLSNSGEEL